MTPSGPTSWQLPFAEYVAGRYNCYGALPEHLRKRIRRQMETLPDFAAYFSIQITEKQ